MFMHGSMSLIDGCVFTREVESSLYETWRGGVGVGEGIEQRRESKGEREGWEEGEG